MLEKYDQSIQALQLYMNITKLIPSEKEWNRFAMEEKLLSSQSIQYLSQSGFNKLCRKQLKIRQYSYKCLKIKNIKKERRNLYEYLA